MISSTLFSRGHCFLIFLILTVWSMEIVSLGFFDSPIHPALSYSSSLTGEQLFPNQHVFSPSSANYSMASSYPTLLVPYDTCSFSVSRIDNWNPLAEKGKYFWKPHAFCDFEISQHSNRSIADWIELIYLLLFIGRLAKNHIDVDRSEDWTQHGICRLIHDVIDKSDWAVRNEEDFCLRFFAKRLR